MGKWSSHSPYETKLTLGQLFHDSIPWEHGITLDELNQQAEIVKRIQRGSTTLRREEPSGIL